MRRFIIKANTLQSVYFIAFSVCIQLQMSNKGFNSFYLLQTNGKSKLSLPVGNSISVGRSALTQIKDRRLSRNHLKIFVSKKTDRKVTIEHVGSNCSTLNGKIIKKGFVGPALLNSKIELLQGKYEYKLVMEENYVTSTNETLKHWSNGLLQSMNDPNMVTFEDAEICIIKDKFPKAMQHFLVLPKKEKLVNLTKLTNLHIDLVHHMINSAKFQIIEKFKDKDIEFRYGFHAIPSMSQIHMHVISQDFISPCLKTKKHWNSFNTNYFVEAETVLKYLSKEGCIPSTVEMEAKKWLLQDVKCHKCSHKPRGMGIPFKQHLEEHYNR